MRNVSEEVKTLLEKKVLTAEDLERIKREVPVVLWGDALLPSSYRGKAILKTEEGLTQLVRCPRCLYHVRQSDIVWKRQPDGPFDEGDIESCRFCHTDGTP